jgi:hypothetical protein
MDTQLGSSQAAGYPHEHYRRDRRVTVQKRCESDTVRWRMAQIEGVIADLERMVTALNIEIQAEELRSGVNDPAQFDYPILAMALTKRRANAMRSIDVLRRELAELNRVAVQKGELIIA